QGLAEPGGIIISGTVHDQVRGKLVVGYEFAGSQQVKNIAEPVPAFRVRLDAGSAPTLSSRLCWRPWVRAPKADRRMLVSPEVPMRRTHQRLLWTGLALVAFFFLVNVFSSIEEGSTEIWFR